MPNSNCCKIRIQVPEEFLGFCIQELTAASGNIESITCPAPGKQTVEAVLPIAAYASLVGKIRNYVGSDDVTFERSEE